MKCSLKDGFINILFVVFIAPSEGVEFPLQTNSVTGEPMTHRQLRPPFNDLQHLDSFPDDGDSEFKLHKIVKKQMTAPDSGDSRERSIFTAFFEEGEHAAAEDLGKPKNSIDNLEMPEPGERPKNDRGFFEDFVGEVNYPKRKRSIFSKPAAEPSSNDKNKNVPVCKEGKSNGTQTSTPSPKIPKQQESPNACETPKPEPDVRNEEKLQRENKNFQKRYIRVPDLDDYRCYYEFETNSFGCIKLRHKRCPDGQFFSFRYLKCLKVHFGPGRELCPDTKPEPKPKSMRRRKKRCSVVTKFRRAKASANPPEEQDPSNEWLDVTQESKIPTEFKPGKKPELRIYHLLIKKKLNGVVQRIQKRHALRGSADSLNFNSRTTKEIAKGLVKRQEPKKTHHARSFLIRIHKKVGKDDEGVTENEESDNDEEEDNDDEYDEDEESDDEDEDVDDDVTDITQKDEPNSKETLKDLLKSAKEAVTNRARFNEGPIEPRILRKSSSSFKAKKSDDIRVSEKKSKKVLIDANIKVDSALGNALKSVLKSKRRGDQDKSISVATDNEALISDRGSQDQMDPELIRMYENLLRHNPRVKRYFLLNCAKRGN